MSNLQTYYHFKPDFQKVDQRTGRKLLIHGTKRRKDRFWRHMFWRLFLDLLLMGWRGCASAMGAIKTPILLF